MCVCARVRVRVCVCCVSCIYYRSRPADLKFTLATIVMVSCPLQQKPTTRETEHPQPTLYTVKRLLQYHMIQQVLGMLDPTTFEVKRVKYVDKKRNTTRRLRI